MTHNLLYKYACCTSIFWLSDNKDATPKMAMAENLNRAIQNGDEGLVKALVKDGAAMDHLLGMRGTALCAALSARQSSIATYLIDAGCGVNVEDYDREPPLYLAISKGCFEVVKKLVSHPECNINKADPLTKTPPVCLAVSCGYSDVVTWFIQAGADLNVKDVNGSTPLHISIKTKQYEIMQNLVKADCNLYLTDQNGQASVHLSASDGDIRSLEVLLSKWIKFDEIVNENFLKTRFSSKREEDNVSTLINYKSKVRNDTPLKLAILRCHSKYIKILLKYGAQPNIIEEGNSPCPLILACVNALERTLDTSVVEWLLDAGADPNHAGNVHSNVYSDSGRIDTPIMYACRLNALPLVKVLVEHGAYANEQNISSGKSYDKTPLRYALENNALDVAWYLMRDCSQIIFDSTSYNLLCALSSMDSDDVYKIVKFLVAKGFPINGNELDENMPLDNAIMHENVNLVRALVENGANVNILYYDMSPLHRCAEVGNVDIARILLSSGANINKRNSQGVTALRTALDYADDEHVELCYFLLDADSAVPDDMAFVRFDLCDSNTNYCNVPRDTDDSSDTSDSDSVDSDVPPALEHDRNLRTSLFQISSTPRDLVKMCLQCIRDHFIQNGIRFSNISELPIPKKLIDKLLYKT